MVCILCDVVFLNGFEIRHHITEQKHPKSPQIPTIMRGNLAQCRKRGRDKPFKFHVRNHVLAGEEEREGGGEKKMLSCIPSKLSTAQTAAPARQCVDVFDRATRVQAASFPSTWRLGRRFSGTLT